MVKPPPCRVCRKWFRPDRKVGDQQHVCGSAACQRELHRQNCADWHRRNPGLEQEARFEERLVEPDPATQDRLADPLEAIDWPYAKGVIDLRIVALVRETGKVILRRARDLSIGQVAESKRLLRKVIDGSPRDEIGDRLPLP